MNTRSIFLAAFLILLAVPPGGRAQAPGVITYQGRITNAGATFNGPGAFRFLIYRNGMPPASLWSHDSSSVGGAMPATAVSLPVTNGLFSVGLGETAVAGMTSSIPASIFSNGALRLRIWFSDGVIPDAVITDHAITSAGYAFFAQSVADGSITSGKLANGAVGSTQLADDITLSNAHLAFGGVETVTLDAATAPGQGAQLAMRSGLGLQTFVLDADTPGRGGSLALRSGNDRTTVFLDAHEGGAGALSLRDTFGIETVDLAAATGIGAGARFELRNGAGRTTITAAADGSGNAGSLAVYNNAEKLTVLVDGDEGSGLGGIVEVFNNGGTKRAELDGQGQSGGGELVLLATDEVVTVNLRAAEAAGTGARLDLHQANGLRTVVVDAQGSTGGGFVELYKANGVRTVWFDADSGGEGKISTQVLEITGGADFSETFDIQSPDARPGLLVRIDTAHPGELAVSDRAYDRTVAGVVSGAGGVKPGVLMGQRGTAADGRHPVALTGRVYCFVDAERGAIEPGDLITTSDTPGHGMKVGDHARAQGAIIGKAMTGLASGRGLVLVLVSLQ